MFIKRVTDLNTKKNNRKQNNSSINLKSKLGNGAVSFKSEHTRETLEKLVELLKSRKPLEFDGKTTKDKIASLTKYFLEKNSTVGTRFKEAMNPVLEYLASKGILIEVKPYNKNFENKIICNEGEKSHLASTWLDAHRYDSNMPHYTYLTPNTARIGAIDSIRLHSTFYVPSLFNEDIAASRSESDFSKYLPKLPEYIKDKMQDLVCLKYHIQNSMKNISGATDESFKTVLQILMPEYGILSNKTLKKVPPKADDYEPVYAKPFDWDKHIRMINKPFTI